MLKLFAKCLERNLVSKYHTSLISCTKRIEVRICTHSQTSIDHDINIGVNYYNVFVYTGPEIHSFCAFDITLHFTNLN